MPNVLKGGVQHTSKTPIYNIGAASRLTGISIGTLRWVEKQGLVSPIRTDGNQRLFTDEEIELLNVIRDLMEENVNLPGIRVIIRLKLLYKPRHTRRMRPREAEKSDNRR